MIDLVQKEDCCGCEACYNICGEEAIYMKVDNEGFYYPVINYGKCIQCQKCELVCQSMKRNLKKEEEKTKAYACFNMDKKIREKSTSGGVFPLIAKYIIEELHGVVYGVKFDDDYIVRQDRAESMFKVRKFSGSKYVQSKIGKTYINVKNDLEKGRVVLFTGMPCQVEALLNVLGKKYSGLYCMDMICFGIGSPGIWNKYLEGFHDKKLISEIVFKDKRYGWKNWSIKIVENGIEKYYGNRENFYMNSYLKCLNVRKCCSKCNNKGINRKSDITIADGWGTAENNIELNDNMGLSAMLLHSKKGRKIFKAIEPYIKYQEYPAHKLMEGNWAAYYSITLNEKREEFMKMIQVNGVKETLEKYGSFNEGE